MKCLTGWPGGMDAYKFPINVKKNPAIKFDRGISDTL